MSSDLPPPGHATSLAMAKVLVTYLDCPHAIHREILAQFDRPPAIHTIRNLRATYVRRRDMACQPAFHPEDTYRPDRTAAEEASKRFLAAIQAERRAA